ncbi:SWIM zinc finger protein [Anaerobacterium chartisolvens]|uniref:SWIM zinc finger protein n=1 Tax=Anaerobacterium chartisolvens TaxID=1297424 RepID=A0A369BFA8_9FIRM|nr:SWIM zinc finger family protein [Anaerobacterium chartisolvens]RCX18384.1 SWIM zinc finger protein [Anaerobacterium chartisolvens]
MPFYGFPEYVPVAEKKRKAQKAVEKLKKKNPDISPVVIQGRKLAVTWWGKAWNDNLESYSDYENRIDRGRSYVRNGAVLDLKIEKGTVIALVQGSSSKPYKVEIGIAKIKNEAWEKIKKSCEGKIESLQELIDGKFPKALSELFTAKGSGLFPSPKETSLSCSCPDWAVMCKHVAAVLYGIGARLDENPALFFTLRNVNIEELITEAIKGKTRDMLGRTGAKSRRILEDADLGAMFGVEMDSTGPAQDVKEQKKRGRKKKE